MSENSRTPRNCYATRPIGQFVLYCERSAFHDGDHKDDHGFWSGAASQLTPSQEIALMRESNKRVASYKGDPRRDPALAKDLSAFIVAPPTRRAQS